MKLTPVVLTGTFREDYFDDNGTNYGLAFDEEGGVCDYSIVLCSSVRDDSKGLFTVVRRTDHGIHDFEGRHCKVTIEEVGGSDAIIFQVLTPGNWVRYRQANGTFPSKPVYVTAVGRTHFLGASQGSSVETAFQIDMPAGTWVGAAPPIGRTKSGLP